MNLQNLIFYPLDDGKLAADYEKKVAKNIGKTYVIPVAQRALTMTDNGLEGAQKKVRSAWNYLESLKMTNLEENMDELYL